MAEEGDVAGGGGDARHTALLRRPSCFGGCRATAYLRFAFITGCFHEHQVLLAIRFRLTPKYLEIRLQCV